MCKGCIKNNLKSWQREGEDHSKCLYLYFTFWNGNFWLSWDNDGLIDSTGEQVEVPCSEQSGAPLMCVDENFPIVHGLKNHDCNHEGKVLFESLKVNYEWTRETVVDNDFYNCEDGWFWDGEEGCVKVKLIL